jgi:hypothetical protein
MYMRGTGEAELHSTTLWFFAGTLRTDDDDGAYRLACPGTDQWIRSFDRANPI